LLIVRPKIYKVYSPIWYNDECDVYDISKKSPELIKKYIILIAILKKM